jgi:hypothetical protein
MTVLEVPCGSEKHRIELRDDGTTQMLDHDEDMVRSFLAFGANPPSCFVILGLIRGAEAAYQEATGKWTHVQWPQLIGHTHLPMENRWAKHIEPLLEKARADEAERIEKAMERRDAAGFVLRMVERSLGLGPMEAMSYTGFNRNLFAAQQKLEEANEYLEAHRAVVTDYEKALKYAQRIEQLAQETEKRMAEAREAFLNGDFYRAWGRANATIRSAAPRFKEATWRFYVNNLLMLQDAAGVFDVHVAGRGPASFLPIEESE